MRRINSAMVRKALIGATAVCAGALFAGAASADTVLTLVGPIQGNTVGPQSTSNPCIIAGTTCQQPAFMDYNNFTSSGGISSFNMFSTNANPGSMNGTNVPDGVKGVPYTVGTFTNNNLAVFDVAIDVNTSGAAGETLQSFQVLDCGTDATCANPTVLFHFTGPTLIGNVANNGNGFADWTLNTVSLAGLPSTDNILFHAVWNNASDGAESFFHIPVPGPVLGAGLPGLLAACGGLLALARRRRKLVA